MELHIQADFECVYYINGDFFECADSLSAPEYEVIYITVLPLKTTLLPYTVKLCGYDPVKTDLYFGLRLDERHYMLSLSPRYMTVYSQAPSAPAATSPISRLFAFIKKGDIDSAYAMLSPALKSTLEKRDLADFFDGYERIAECTWEKLAEPRFYMIDGNGNAKPHFYSLDGGFIDNIVEL